MKSNSLWKEKRAQRANPAEAVFRMSEMGKKQRDKGPPTHSGMAAPGVNNFLLMPEKIGYNETFRGGPSDGYSGNAGFQGQ